MNRYEKDVIDKAILWSNQMKRPASERKEMFKFSMWLFHSVKKLLKSKGLRDETEKG